MTRARLEQLAQQWRRYLTIRELMFSAALVAAGTAAAVLWIPTRYSLPGASAAFAVALALRLSRSRPWQIDAAQTARHLDRAYPQLEESSTLWLQAPGELSRLERLQLQRADEAAQSLTLLHGGAFGAPRPKSLRLPVALASAGVALLIIAIWWTHGRASLSRALQSATTTANEANRTSPPPSVATPPQIREAEMIIAPPRYTARPERRVTGLNAEVEEGAHVTWSVILDQPVERLQLHLTTPLPLQELDGALRGSRAVTDTELYHVTALLPDGRTWRSPDIYSVKAVKDQPPALKIIAPALPRTEFSSADQPPKIEVEVVATDDYAIAGAHLIATVAKGTGEAVKFREEKIAFDREEADAPGGGRRFTKLFDLVALGLEPGDELYFHVEAADNREPSRNQTRSETRFIVWKGPEQHFSTPGTGVAGVNLVPAYFRSQRQIIIDTEKLIADQPTLAAAEFQNRANNLAIDQQMLRQRYGQFLGEEAEMHEAHSPDDGHDHGAEMPAPPPRTQSEVAAQYGHQHDVQDSATLFDREVKGTMRQALAAMWEAERFLRMAQPAEALAPENRALEILKELQQADRAYVQRVGFEAAPLQIAERRLKGDLSTVSATGLREQSLPESAPADAQIRALLQLAPWQKHAGAVTSAQSRAIEEVEPRLAEAAAGRPEEFLDGLAQLRRLAAGHNLAPNESSQIERALLRLLPSAPSPPLLESELAPSMADAYFRQLNPETQSR